MTITPEAFLADPAHAVGEESAPDEHVLTPLERLADVDAEAFGPRVGVDGVNGAAENIDDVEQVADRIKSEAGVGAEQRLHRLGGCASGVV